jgi:hypothetical protein
LHLGSFSKPANEQSNRSCRLGNGRASIREAHSEHRARIRRASEFSSLLELKGLLHVSSRYGAVALSTKTRYSVSTGVMSAQRLLRTERDLQHLFLSGAVVLRRYDL